MAGSPFLTSQKEEMPSEDRWWRSHRLLVPESLMQKQLMRANGELITWSKETGRDGWMLFFSGNLGYITPTADAQASGPFPNFAEREASL